MPVYRDNSSGSSFAATGLSDQCPAGGSKISRILRIRVYAGRYHTGVVYLRPAGCHFTTTVFFFRACYAGHGGRFCPDLQTTGDYDSCRLTGGAGKFCLVPPRFKVDQFRSDWGRDSCCPCDLLSFAGPVGTGIAPVRRR